MAVPNYIRRFREAHGVTASQLALEIGVHQSAVSKWESGDREVSDDFKAALAKYFNVPVTAIFDFEYHPLADALRRTLETVAALRFRVDRLESEASARREPVAL